ncbi:MAG TPA: hypothetical protein VHS59_03055 [Bacillota bacterium]|nr:hypothetical protein [Bacillota bacterium]
MVTVRSAIQVGVRLINKNPKLLLIPLIWHLISSLLLYAGLTPGAAWPLDSRFFLRFALPASWPGIDQVLPVPALSPDFAALLTGRLVGEGVLFFSKVVAFVILDSLARSWFLVSLRNTFVGKRNSMSTNLGESLTYLNSFIILRLITLAAMLLLTAVARNIPGLPAAFWDIPITLGTLAVLPADMVLVFSKYTMPDALLKGLSLLKALSNPLLRFLLTAAMINGVLSVPINWATGFFPAFVLGGWVFDYFGVILSAGLMYIFTTALLATQEG